MAETVDIAIIGGGIAGVSLAYFLSPHRSVAVLERETALGYHSSGRSAAEFAFRFHSALVGKLAKISYPFLTNPPGGFTETELLKRRGNLVIADAEKAARLADVFAEESAAAPGLERLTVEQAIERAPILNPDYVADAFYDPDCWDIEAENLLQGCARGARANGATIRNKAEVLGARREGGIWLLETTAGEMRAQTVVNAAGAWADSTAQLFGLKPLGIIPYRRTAITVAMPAGIDVGALPEISEIDEAFYMKPEAGRLLVSPADATESQPCDAQPEELDIAYAAWYLEQATTVAVSHVSHSWAGLRTFAQDRAPVVGYSGEGDGFFWLAGQGGFGIQTAPALGRLATDLILGHAVAADFAEHGLTAELFAPSRFE
ncbi:Glycine/D-amino acid oxidase [Mesorhizobium albiziae]|uniref:Glycine/D-amino acid oxidase n=1 Tax=Neomesorhizobium albiziae TaxID=335020 RepID=A0A1I3WMQ1_9HYPH|nr:FAD-binding oxidoreductase [Mesorhizobium albiziae]GLS31729.1 glycerol-3-phosphate dehydrogenase [Mesorhizobium albiziae]SFK08459.1 Glycine/D-amino acid oxidase [Mesorhizobium albiziae]